MDREERRQVERVLSRIPQEAFEQYLYSADGRELQEKLTIVRAALREAGRLGPGAPRRPVSELLDLLGHRILSDDSIGAWVREQIIRRLPRTKYERLVGAYRECAGRRADVYHGKMKQAASGSWVMAQYWHQGSDWAFSFCEIAGLPEVLAKRRGRVLPEDEDVIPTKALDPLHTFQVEVHRRLRRFLKQGRGRAAMLSLPTGAGKTRVTVQALCEHLAGEHDAGRRGTALWISQSDELQRQAWECFRQVWQTGVIDGANTSAARHLPLRVVRLWGGRQLDSISIPDQPTVLIAGIGQLRSWVNAAQMKRGARARLAREVIRSLTGRRLGAVVVDEAHHLGNDETRRVLVALCLRAKREWKPASNAAPVVGLTATPWRTQRDELRRLVRFFGQRLLRPGSLGNRPISTLVRKRVLARVVCDHITVDTGQAMTAGQRRRFERYKELPADFLEQLGRDPVRNAKILNKLRQLPKRSRVLVFACSVKHAQALAMMLNEDLGPDVARVVTGETPRAERFAVIDEFRRGDGVRFLVNVGVLTTGFDAPKVDVVCLARPTASSLLYEQMVGRGLRGPRNGGTASCRVIDVQDRGLPDEVLSYARVLDLWERPR